MSKCFHVQSIPSQTLSQYKNKFTCNTKMRSSSRNVIVIKMLFLHKFLINLLFNTSSYIVSDSQTWGNWYWGTSFRERMTRFIWCTTGNVEAVSSCSQFENVTSVDSSKSNPLSNWISLVVMTWFRTPKFEHYYTTIR